MLNLALIYYSMLHFALQSALAQVPVSEQSVLVDHDSLTILGRGIQDQKTDSVIALACAGEPDDQGIPNCRRLRHIQFTANDGHTQGEAIWLGPEFIPTSQTPISEQDFKKIARSINQNFRTTVKTQNKEAREQKIENIGAGALGVSIVTAQGLSNVGIITGLSGGLIIALPLIGVSIAVGVAKAISNRPILKNKGQVSSSIANQNGWNWSLDPKRTSHKRYIRYLEYLRYLEAQGSQSVP